MQTHELVRVERDSPARGRLVLMLHDVADLASLWRAAGTEIVLVHGLQT